MGIVGWLNGIRTFLQEVGWYRLYALLLMLLTYMLNQLDRYNLPILTQSMARDLHYGDKACFPNATTHDTADARVECPHEATESLCVQHQLKNDTSKHEKVCYWDYNGQGIQYALLASILFVIVYTISGIFLGFAADLYQRKTFIAVSLFLWSVITLLTGFTNAYWQLVILRLGLGVAEAGCSPFATSILADVFAPEYRGTALGVYNWGIYTGYSLSYALGDFISSIIGWRGVYYVAAVPGLLIAPLIFFTLSEPRRRVDATVTNSTQNQKTYRQLVAEGNGYGRSLGILMKPLFVPSVLVLCIAGAIRNGAGYVWGFYTQPYFLAQGATKETIGAYMTPIPLIGGCLSAVAGGFIADLVVKRSGLRARVLVLVASQLLAAPFALGVLWLPVPWAFISLIPTYLFGEMWVSVCLAVFVEMIPAASRTFGIACYFFIITNIGGNMPFLVPVIQQALVGGSGFTPPHALRAALTILYPGSYVVSALIFILCIFFVKRREANEALAASLQTPEPALQSPKWTEGKLSAAYTSEDDDRSDDAVMQAGTYAPAGIAHTTVPRSGKETRSGMENGNFQYGSTGNVSTNSGIKL